MNGKNRKTTYEKPHAMNKITLALFAIITIAISYRVLMPAAESVNQGDSEARRDQNSTSAILVAAKPDGAGQQGYLLGIALELDPGWKTYWRTPGDSGVAPEFDWSGSANLRHAEIFWPLPDYNDELSGVSIGYKDKVIFPVQIIPEDGVRPIALALVLDYAVCADICIPVTTAHSLILTPDMVLSADDIEQFNAFQQQVPVLLPPGQLPAPFNNASLSREGKTLILTASRDAPIPDKMFAEGEGLLSFGPPVTEQGGLSGSRLIFPAYGFKYLPKNQTSTAITLTTALEGKYREASFAVTVQ